MQEVSLPEECDEETFRTAARQCLAQKIPPEQLIFTSEGSASLFGQTALETIGGVDEIHVPRRFVELVSKVLCHTASDRFALLYRMLWRIRSGERDLLDRITDPDVIRSGDYTKAVERDVYRMHAFVRFAERRIDGKVVYVAWYEPRHRVLRRAASFFVDRFRNMDWLIATPLGTAAWRDGELAFGPPAARPARHSDAVLDEVWMTYYRATFNPARLRVKAMTAQMPKKHWATLPESALIPELVQQAASRVQNMQERGPDTPPRFAAALDRRRLPETSVVGETTSSLERVRSEAASCTLCPLYGPATQTVFGEGPLDATVMFVGEQPGDQEDLTGRPFVGPAGQLFDRALAGAEMDRSQVYVTNAVKHFKFEPRGKRRIHSKPGHREVISCRAWLMHELSVIKPRLVVALGATAMLALTGRSVAVTKERGRISEYQGLNILVTVHPSFLLRIPNPELARSEYARFVEDLRIAQPWYVAANVGDVRAKRFG